MLRSLRPRVLVLALATACGTASSSGSDAMPAPERPRFDRDRARVEVPPSALEFVATETVVPGGTSRTVEAPGRTAFRDDAVARVGPPVPGRVQAVHVHLGDHVRVGTPLVTLGSPDAASARAELRVARTALRAARVELDRQNALLERGVGLARERVAAEAAVAHAESELARAQQANALIGRDRGGVVVVRAPIDGVVLSRSVTKGAIVDPSGDPMIEIGDPDALWVVADVFDDDLPALREGARATVEIAGHIGSVDASVVAIGGAVDTRLRRAPVWLQLDERPPTLRAGSYARVEIDVGERGVPFVPASAVVLQDGVHATVYVALGEGVFERRPVSVGRPVRGHLPVQQGIVAGEDVVVEGVLLLDGAVEQLL